MNRRRSVVILSLLGLFALASQACVGIIVVSEAGLAAAASAAAAIAVGATVVVPP